MQGACVSGFTWGRPIRRCRAKEGRLRRGLNWVAGVVVLALSGCGSEDCDSVGYAAVAVRVQDASGEQVCDAAVRVTDGDFSEELFASDTSGDCVYYGAYERAGTYRVEASRSGATGIVEGIEVVTTGGCGVLNTAQVAVELSA